MICRANGVPQPTITWIKIGSNDVLGSGEQFTIINTSGGDDGTYTCIAKNELDEDRRDVTLNVQSKSLCRLDILKVVLK